jgi:hypothetical protein
MFLYFLYESFKNFRLGAFDFYLLLKLTDRNKSLPR